MNWTGISREVVPLVWPHCEGLVEEALSQGIGEYSPEDIYRECCVGKMQLWLAVDEFGPKSLCVTQFSDFPQRRVCWIICAAGKNYEEMLRLANDVLVPWAKSYGASVLRAHGRSGWERPAAKFGWVKRQIIVERNLEDA